MSEKVEYDIMMSIGIWFFVVLGTVTLPFGGFAFWYISHLLYQMKKKDDKTLDKQVG